MVLETNMKLCVTELKKSLLKKIFLLNLFFNENLYYLLCSYTNPIFGKFFVPEIWAKMSSANQIAGFFNEPYLHNKSVK